MTTTKYNVTNNNKQGHSNNIYNNINRFRSFRLTIIDNNKQGHNNNINNKNNNNRNNNKSSNNKNHNNNNNINNKLGLNWAKFSSSWDLALLQYQIYELDTLLARLTPAAACH